MNQIDIGEKLFPMAGVSLLVLVILIASAPTLMTKTSTRVNLPRAHVVETDLEDNISISLRKDGSLYINDKPASLDTLVATVKRLEEADTAAPYYKLVIIRADSELDFGRILEVLDSVKKSGAKRVAFSVIKKKGS